MSTSGPEVFVIVVFVVAFSVATAVHMSGRVRAAFDQRRNRAEESARFRESQVDQQARQERVRRDEETSRLLRRPRDFLYVAGLQLKSALAGPKGELADLRRRLQDAAARSQQLDEMPWTGLQAVVRVTAALLLPAVLVTGGLLNVLVFIALNDGVIAPAPILKGVGAAMLELLLALGFARLLHNVQRTSFQWLMEMAFVSALLTSVVGFVAMYSPQRSEQAYQRAIDIDQRELTAAEQSGQQLAITAARDQLNQDQIRLRRAEASDVALAVALPLIEVAVAPMAIEGGVVLARAARRRVAVRTVEELRRAVNAKEIEIDQKTQEAVVAAMAHLRGTGVENIEMYGDPSRQPPAPQGLPVAEPPTAPATGPAAVPAEDASPADARPASAATETSNAGAFDLDGFAPATRQAGSGRWDRA